MIDDPCGAAIPVPGPAAVDMLPHRASAWGQRLARRLALVHATILEIFDEAAYQRFLNRTQQRSSVHAYAAFREENERAQARRPRCC